MDRVWLRDYEKMLSSNRRSIDVRPRSADISNNRVKKGRPERTKKRRDNFTSEAEVARQLLTVGTDLDEYEPHLPEKKEKELFQRTILSQQKKPTKSGVPVSFKKLTTFDEFVGVENQRQLCFETGDSELFRTLYPDVRHEMSPPKTKTGTIARPKSSPQIRKPHVPFQMTCVAENEVKFRAERPPAQFDQNLAKKALELWKTALTSLRMRGKEIAYEDISKFSKKWKRSTTLRRIVMYISILLGLKGGEPSVTHRSVFRELYTLLKFFREVNPLTIPKRRLIKANSYFKNHIKNGAESEPKLYTSDEDNFELNILGWLGAMQDAIAIVMDAKKKHEIMNASYDENVHRLEEEYANMDPTSTTPFKHMKQRGGEIETPKQRKYRLAKLSPTGTWSTRLTTPAKFAVTEEKSMGEGLSSFDSTGAQSFIDVSHSINIPLEDMSLEYSPDRSETKLPSNFPNHVKDDPYEELVNRCSS